MLETEQKTFSESFCTYGSHIGRCPEMLEMEMVIGILDTTIEKLLLAPYMCEFCVEKYKNMRQNNSKSFAIIVPCRAWKSLA